MSNCNIQPIRTAPDAIWVDSEGEVLDLPRNDEPLTIETVARMFRLLTLTLRYFEFRGVIARKQRFGQGYVYTWGDCDRIAFIIKARRVGLKLNDIVPLFDLAHGEPSALTLEGQQEKCLELIEHLEHRRRHFDDMLGELRRRHTLLLAKMSEKDIDAERN
jgi:DNA-binding transcriptional MerR regulator